MKNKKVDELIQGQTLVEIPHTASVRDAARLMVERGVGSVLVMNGDKLEGIFTERDALNIFVATRRNPDQTDVGDVMTKNPETIPPGTTAGDAQQRMMDGNYRHLPVVDGGKVLGIVSSRSLLPE
ncbi:MAG: CBS domain-containing protein [Rhodospirillales bacterium]|nr:CBS domain-containing protein [Rhodospirillales bacterium]